MRKLREAGTEQMRAQAVEALGKLLQNDGGPEALKSDTYVAAMKLLDAPDFFVVSRATPIVGYG